MDSVVVLPRARARRPGPGPPPGLVEVRDAVARPLLGQRRVQGGLRPAQGGDLAVPDRGARPTRAETESPPARGSSRRSTGPLPPRHRGGVRGHRQLGDPLLGQPDGQGLHRRHDPAGRRSEGPRRRRSAGPPSPTPAGTSTTFQDSGLTANTQYSYALFAHDASSNFVPRHGDAAHRSDCALTGLVATSVTRTSVALAWTNPDDADFTGVTIRRADGPTPPVSATDGTLVADVRLAREHLHRHRPARRTRSTPTRSSPTTLRHVAAAATLTVTTRSPGTDRGAQGEPAASGTATNVTVDTAVAFDASDSLAAEVRTSPRGASTTATEARWRRSPAPSLRPTS